MSLLKALSECDGKRRTPTDSSSIFVVYQDSFQVVKDKREYLNHKNTSVKKTGEYLRSDQLLICTCGNRI